MARKDWEYTDSSHGSHGTMRCAACGKSVQGEYRVRNGRNGFVVMHRSCSSEDVNWTRIDGQRAKRAANDVALLHAAIAFRDRWQVSALDDLIESLEAQS